MINPMKILTAALVVTGLGIAPASAASLHQPAQIQNVQFSFQIQGGDNDRRGRFERRGNGYYYNGYEGSRERRSGWRNYNGYWFPQSAFSFSIGVDPDRRPDRRPERRSDRLSSAHYEWCEGRYRSYRSSDNSFQPFNGGRQECFSPYSR